MGKTRAEIQKAYRERKKAKEGHVYLTKETERVKRYYKPTIEIGPNKLKVRRERVRMCMQRQRQQRRNTPLCTQGGENESLGGNPVVRDEQHLQGPCDSTTNIPVVGESSSKMVVNMNFCTKKGSWKKSSHLKKAEKKIKTLNAKVKMLVTRNNTLRKRIQRVNQCTPDRTNPNTDVTQKDVSPIIQLDSTNNAETSKKKRKMIENESNLDLTPKSKSADVLRRAGLTPRKHPKLVKHLTFHHAVVEEIKQKVVPQRGRAHQRTSLQIMCGNVIKRYRLGSKSSHALGVDRRQIDKATTAKLIQKRRNAMERAKLADKIVSYFERDDNSTCLPGKRDKIKTKSGNTQSRVLNDYLQNLHLKFKSENPQITIGLTLFSSFRPKYIKLVKFSSRRTCLCHKHQNMTLKLKGLKSVGVINTENPDVLISKNTDDEILEKIDNCSLDTVKFSQWKRKEVEHKGRITKRMVIENLEMAKTEFVKIFKDDLIAFRTHVYRVKTQYLQITKLKEIMPSTHAVCQMDFAENYSCGHADEIQTAYFDKCSVTLHPVVIYTKDKENMVGHTSYIFVSDTPAHNSGTIYAFLKRITDTLKQTRPEIECIHYVTDSPTSQYRNKSMIYIVANHHDLLGLRASWQYWEAGHGKGPCDGVGGTSKRLADLAVKRQIAVIQSAEDYFHWGDSAGNSQIKYVFVPKEECDQSQAQLSSLSIKSIKGTLDLHSVVQLNNGKVGVRNTSCFCNECFQNGVFKTGCEGWRVHDVLEKKQVSVKTKDTGTVDSVREILPNTELYTENSYVAAVYNGHWYIGKVVECDTEDESLQYHVSFMDHGKGKLGYTFKWPNHEDKIWCSRLDILCSVSEPILGTRKTFKLPDMDVTKVLDRFERNK